MSRRPEGTVRRALEKRAQHGVAELLDEIVQVREIELDRIAPNPRQPRRHVDAAGIEQLARSIEAHGLLQPIVVRANAAGFELVAGSRRLRAVQRLGRPRITALVLKDGDAETLALIENLQRVDLDPIDEAEALATLKESRDITLETMQQLVGKSVSYLSEIMSLLRLPASVRSEARALAAEGRAMPRASLVELARIKDEDVQLGVWREMCAGDRGRADLRALRKGVTVERRPRRKSGFAIITRRIEGLSEFLSQVREDEHWRQPEVRKALQELRSRIDLLLGDTA